MFSKKIKKYLLVPELVHSKTINTGWKSWAGKELNMLSVQILSASDPCHFSFHKLCQLDTLIPFGV